MSDNGRDPYLGMVDFMRREAAGQVPVTFVIGKVLAVTATTLRIQADGHELDEQDILVNAALQADFEETADFTVKAGDMIGNCTLSGFAACGLGAHSSFQITGMAQGQMKSIGKYHVTLRLAAGDLVMLIPSADRQLYYLVMKVVRYGSVSADQPA